MIRPESSTGQHEPLHAVTDLSLSETLKPSARDLVRFGDLVSPEGYNVSSYDGAVAYMIDIHGKDKDELRFRSAEDVEDALKNEMRAAKYLNGRRQSVYEHTQALGIICLEEIKKRPDLQPIEHLVRMMYDVHDWPEAAGEDTVINDRKALASKPYREEAGFVILEHDLGPNNPHIVALRAYNAPRTILEKKAASFVGGGDKDEPYEHDLRPDVKATLHRERQEDFPSIVITAFRKIYDPSMLVRAQRTFTTLGERWVEWGCKPYEGSAGMVVMKAFNQVVQERIEGKSNIEPLPFVPTQPFSFQPAITEEELKSRRIPILDSRRADQNPLPPAPPVAMAIAV